MFIFSIKWYLFKLSKLDEWVLLVDEKRKKFEVMVDEDDINRLHNLLKDEKKDNWYKKSEIKQLFKHYWWIY